MSDNTDTLEEILKPWRDEVESEYGTGINDDKKPQFIAIEQAKQALNLYIEERVAEAYKEGYAKSGIDMYQSMERAKVEVERQLRED